MKNRFHSIAISPSKTWFLSSLLGLISLFFACQSSHNEEINSDVNIANDTIAFSSNDFTLRWKLLTNFLSPEQSQSQARFTLINNGKQALKNNNWALYFNQSPRKLLEGKTTGNVTIRQINGDFYQMIPTSNFELLEEDTAVITYDMSGFMIKDSDGPCGVYIVLNEGKKQQQILPIDNYTIEAFETSEQLNRFTYDHEPIVNPAAIFEGNSRLNLLSKKDLLKVVPSPFQVGNSLGTIEIDRSFSIQHQKGLRKEAIFLAWKMEVLLGAKMRIEVGNTKTRKAIHLKRDTSIRVNGVQAEAYHLQFSEEEGISIKGYDGEGIFYGIQSLLAMVPVEAYANPRDMLQIPMVTLLDAPRFPYRAIYLDVARNFHSKKSVLKMLDLMAFYKLNRLVLGLSNDEGWRLEIKGLPELTEIGGRRGHTLEDSTFLHPAYGSGPFPNFKESHGNGFYSAQEYIEILKYAHDRHIQVIPELNVPGHARAAIKAMNTRYQRLKAVNKIKEAEEYLLIDLADTSNYESVQHYPDNVVNVCQESTYQFYEKVLGEVVVLYQNAGVPLNTIHTGGDEVPKGVWVGSPNCFDLKSEKGLSKDVDLRVYFAERISKMFEEKSLQMAGWEEIAMKKDTSGRYIANPDLVNKNLIPYVWNNLWGSQDLGYRLANAGYPVVLCNVTNLYFDLAYDKNPNESGLYWGGFVNTRKAFEFAPSNVFYSTTENAMGKPFDIAVDYKDMERLKHENQKNILGIQAQLWSETIKGQDKLEYYLLPKMLGLAERAWAAQADWETLENDSLRAARLEEDWNVFANTLGQKELYRLQHIFGGFNFRMPPVGHVALEDSVLQVNTAFPGLKVRYTVDGSIPTENSELIQEGMKISEGIRLRAFCE